MVKINIAIAGGPCTGKSTLAAHLYSHLKIEGYDYDLIQEECRKLRNEFGKFKDPFERFYFWRQQEREELRSNAEDGFITDKPLFDYYLQVKRFASKPRDELALRELYRMCLGLNEQKRYGLIIAAEDPDEISYRKDNSRSSNGKEARRRHIDTLTFVKHLWPDKLLLVKGSVNERTEQSLEKIKKLQRKNSKHHSPHG